METQIEVLYRFTIDGDFSVEDINVKKDDVTEETLADEVLEVRY